jgi:hypothetical protein
MLMKTLDEYRKYFDKIRFLSKLASFLLAISAFSSLYFFAIALSYAEPPTQVFWNFVKEDNLLVWLSFLIIILITFFARFICLFYKSDKSFRIGQILWSFGFILIFLYFISYYFLENNQQFDGFYHGEKEPFPYSIKSFQFFAFFYMLLSPIKELLTLIFAFIKSR